MMMYFKIYDKSFKNIYLYYFFIEYVVWIILDFKRGCLIFDCLKYWYFFRICRILIVFKFGG